VTPKHLRKHVPWKRSLETPLSVTLSVIFVGLCDYPQRAERVSSRAAKLAEKWKNGSSPAVICLPVLGRGGGSCLCQTVPVAASWNET
jgi:hypothetical protein